ncbi:MAG: JAB domain-containing protein [archaeon]
MAIILGHNHPSGVVHPSFDDVKVTERLEKAGDILGIELLDYIIIGGNSFYSFKESNDF